MFNKEMMDAFAKQIAAEVVSQLIARLTGNLQPATAAMAPFFHQGSADTNQQYSEPVSHRKPEDQQRAARSPIDALCVEYDEFQKQEQLVLGPADDHMFDEDLEERQQVWLMNFCKRWDAEEKKRGAIIIREGYRARPSYRQPTA